MFSSSGDEGERRERGEERRKEGRGGEGEEERRGRGGAGEEEWRNERDLVNI